MDSFEHQWLSKNCKEKGQTKEADHLWCSKNPDHAIGKDYDNNDDCVADK